MMVMLDFFGLNTLNHQLKPRGELVWPRSASRRKRFHGVMDSEAEQRLLVKGTLPKDQGIKVVHFNSQ
jgi:hypothetical protein